jgi:hypothetical protein
LEAARREACAGFKVRQERERLEERSNVLVQEVAGLEGTRDALQEELASLRKSQNEHLQVCSQR